MEVNKIFESKLNAVIYFDKLINQIDIDAEQTIIEINNSLNDEEQLKRINFVNDQRQNMIEKIKSMDSFAFYIEKNYTKRLNYDPMIGILVFTDSFLPADEIESFKKYLVREKTKFYAITKAHMNSMFIEKQIKNQISIDNNIHVVQIHGNKNLVKDIKMSCLFKLLEPGLFDDFQFLKSLNLATNATSLNAVLNNLINLTVLNLEIYFVEKIDEHLFSSLLNLEILCIISGKISGIHTNAFSCLSKLVKLDLSQNKISSLKGALFRNCTSLKCLDLSFNKIKYINKEHLQGLESLEILKISHTWGYDRRIKIQDFSFVDLSNLKTLFISGPSHINKNTFNGLTSLENLEIAEFGIKNLPDECFINLSKLKRLKISANSEISITARTFEGLINLKELYLRDADRIFSTNKPFLCLKNLEKLTIRNCVIEENSFLFNGISKLRVLDLEDSRVCSFIVFDGIKEIRELYMLISGPDHLKLFKGDHHIIMNEQLRNLNKLTVDLTNENYTLPDYSYYRTFVNHLSLRGTTIQSIDTHNFIPKLSFVRYLDICNKKIDTIQRYCFSSMQCLEKLVLNSNEIKLVDEFAFSNLNRLNELSLKYNSIRFIDNNAFDGLTQLKLLYLNDNDFEDNDSESFENLIEPEVLDSCGYNPKLIDSVDLSKVMNLKILNLSASSIEHVRRDWFKSLTHLEDLVLRINMIKSLDSETFLDLINLRKVDLSYNQLESIDLSIFKNCVKLEKIDAARNNLKSVNFQLLTGLKYLKEIYLENNLFDKIDEIDLPVFPSIEHIRISSSLIEGLQEYRDPLDYMNFE